ncbi:MAG TPA: hypothetical protein VJ742_12740 [Nitrososphaera sp.]|nr:hypothetical protein [Nitrososphaera sp.]
MSKHKAHLAPPYYTQWAPTTHVHHEVNWDEIEENEDIAIMDWTRNHVATTFVIAAVIAVMFVVLLTTCGKVTERGDREHTERLNLKIQSCKTIADPEVRNLCILKISNPEIEMIPASGEATTVPK